MLIDPISSGSIVGGELRTQSAGNPGVADFGALVGGRLSEANSSIEVADQSIRDLAAGHEVSPHDVMISMEQARMHLTMLVEVRNRVVEAYQELARMQL